MPRKRSTATTVRPQTTNSWDRDGLAKLGAVVRAVSLRMELREIEKAYPGTLSLAEAQIQRDNLAHARAVKQGVQASASSSAGPAVSKVATTHTRDRMAIGEEAPDETLANA